nr:2-hydroxyacyl-CoA dehydratase family protein [Candidatus Sigynarchaeum springense]
MLEAFDLCKHVPSPANSDDWKNFVISVLTSGTKEGVAVAKTYRDEPQDRVDRGIAGLPGERHRLLWIQNRIPSWSCSARRRARASREPFNRRWHSSGRQYPSGPTPRARAPAAPRHGV